MTADTTDFAPAYGRDGDVGATAWGGYRSDAPMGLELIGALTHVVEHLKIAQDSNRRIGMAIGIVMNQLEVEDQQAFDVLRRISQNTNRKLSNVAEDVIRDRHL